MGIKGIQVFNNSSNEEWDKDFKIYFNSGRVEVDIITAHIKSTKKSDSGILPLSTMRIIKNIKNLRKEWLFRRHLILINIYSELLRKIYKNFGYRILISLAFRNLQRLLSRG
jgi:hypothetical protein